MSENKTIEQVLEFLELKRCDGNSYDDEYYDEWVERLEKALGEIDE